MKEVVFFRDGQVIVFENEDAVPLRWGSDVYRNTRWVLSDTVFAEVQHQNQDVKFVERRKS